MKINYLIILVALSLLSKLSYSQKSPLFILIEGGPNEDGAPYRYLIRNDSLLLFDIVNPDTIKLLNSYRFSDSTIRMLNDSLTSFRLDTLKKSYVNYMNTKHPHSYYFNIKVNGLDKSIMTQEYFIYELDFIQDIVNSYIQDRAYMIYGLEKKKEKSDN